MTSRLLERVYNQRVDHNGTTALRQKHKANALLMHTEQLLANSGKSKCYVRASHVFPGYYVKLICYLVMHVGRSWAWSASLYINWMVFIVDAPGRHTHLPQ